MDRKMTDDEIIKALECCISYNPPCTTCKYDVDTITCDECMGKLMEDALDLINRQKAENEKLNIELKAMRGATNSYKAEVERLKTMHSEMCIGMKVIKKNAIKEFANNVKKHFFQVELVEYIDSLVEEVEMGLR